MSETRPFLIIETELSLPSHTEREIKRFFQDYKVLENKTVEIDHFLGPAEALEIIRDSLALYRRLRRGEITLQRT